MYLGVQFHRALLWLLSCAWLLRTGWFSKSVECHVRVRECVCALVCVCLCMCALYVVCVCVRAVVCVYEREICVKSMCKPNL